jgi:hypothetical protein
VHAQVLMNAVKYSAPAPGAAAAAPISVNVSVAPPADPSALPLLAIEVLDAGVGLRGQTMAQAHNRLWRAR